MSSSARENLSNQSRIKQWDLDHPFAEGAFRHVAKGYYVGGPRNGQPCVWKWFKQGSVFAESHWKHDVAVVEKALDIVTRFNAGKYVNKPIKVNRASVFTGRDNLDGEKFLVEPFIEYWQKWNSNSGWSSDEEGWCEIMQALSHFSYHAFGGFLVLCDLQGGVYKDGAVISDPVILSRNKSFGPTDLGIDGILTFFEGHQCNEYCRAEWAMPRSRSSGRIPIQRGTLMTDEQDHAPTMDARKPLSKHNQQQYDYSDDDYYD